MIEKDSAFLYLKHCVDVRDYTMSSRVDQSLLLYFCYYLMFISLQTQVTCTNLNNVGAVCSEEKTEIKLKGQETTPSSTYLDVFTADRVSDLLANSF